MSVQLLRGAQDGKGHRRKTAEFLALMWEALSSLVSMTEHTMMNSNVPTGAFQHQFPAKLCLGRAILSRAVGAFVISSPIRQINMFVRGTVVAIVSQISII